MNKLGLNAPCASVSVSPHILFPLCSFTLVWHTCLFDMLSPSNLLSAHSCLSLSGIASQLKEPKSNMRIQRRASLHFAPMTELRSLCDYSQLFIESASCSCCQTLLDIISDIEGYKEVYKGSAETIRVLWKPNFFDILKLFKPPITWKSWFLSKNGKNVFICFWLLK